MPSELADEAIALRVPCQDDVAAMVEAVRSSLDDLMRWTSWCHADYEAEDAVKFLRRVDSERFEDRAYDYFIADATQSRLLGGCGLYHVDRTTGCASLGYWVRRDAAGRGHATRAARLLVRFGLVDLDLTRIEILVATENLASQRVAEKIGATREGVLRNRLVLKGRPTDAVVFSLIPADL
ncbi:MAG TPA: GNAT family protein [Pirellulales bacterium]|jgi:RimJ/RimL family protein N-acetyltransferase